MKDYSQKDVDFVQMMIPHHEKAVEAASFEVHGGRSAEVKRWALDIFSGQRKEIAKFRAWLKDRGIDVEPTKGEM